MTAIMRTENVLQVSFSSFGKKLSHYQTEMVFELTGHVGMSNIDMSNVKVYSNIL